MQLSEKETLYLLTMGRACTVTGIFNSIEAMKQFLENNRTESFISKTKYLNREFFFTALCADKGKKIGPKHGYAMPLNEGEALYVHSGEKYHLVTGICITKGEENAHGKIRREDVAVARFGRLIFMADSIG